LLTSGTSRPRVLSGMRPTGQLHLGHFHGVLKNWLQLQHEYECFFTIVDWHALTTHYENPQDIEQNVWQMAIDWLAVGINPGSACLFVQSWVPEHAELHLLLSMITPLGWVERIPTYKEQQEKLTGRELATYGFLGYPVLQSADILLYRAGLVPVGEDQMSHVELTREIARRFNYLYGREPDFAELVNNAIGKMGKKNAKLYRQLRTQYQQEGEHEALAKAQAMLEDQPNISLGDKERLLGYLVGSGKIILPEPEVMLTDACRLPGVDGQKMSKSYHNTISLREPPAEVERKLLTMPTDPARVKRTDPGDPEKCPVWELHKVYSDDEVQTWVQQGCRSAGIGCIECKRPLIDTINRQLAPIQEAVRDYEQDLGVVKSILAEGSERARDEAKATLTEVREAMGIEY
jgi:tryptophanyl-tRNA synthetase